MKVPQVDGVGCGGLSVVRRILDAYQEFVAADGGRSRAFHIGRNEAVSKKQRAVLVWIGAKNIALGRELGFQSACLFDQTHKPCCRC